MSDVIQASRQDPELTGMRVHELALARWLHQNFQTRPGYPTPVVFATPMDAFAEFDRLFASANNPFAYLLKDVNGKKIGETVWEKDNTGYQFKRSHAISYSQLVVVHMNLLREK